MQILNIDMEYFFIFSKLFCQGFYQYNLRLILT